MAIYCVGDIRADIAVILNDHRLSASRVSLGGTVANFSVISSKLGQKVRLLGTAADDASGRFLLRELSKYGIDTSTVTVTENGMNSILLALDGNQLLGYSIMEVPGTKYDTIGDIDYDSVSPSFGDIVHTSSGFIEDYPAENQKLIAFIERAKSNGAKISFDLNLRNDEFGDTPDRMNVILRIAELSDVLFGAYDEFESLYGMSVGAAVAANANGRIVIARNEADPVLFGCFGETGKIPVEPVNVINPSGAGDTFDAGFHYAQSRTDDLVKCIRFASFISGYMISHPETRAVPPLEDIDSFFNP